MARRSRTNSDGATSDTTTGNHGKIRVVVKTEFELGGAGDNSGQEKEIAGHIFDVLVTDHKVLQREIEKVLNAMTSVSQRWNILEDKLEEVLGDKYDETLVNYPRELDSALQELHTVLETMQGKADSNGKWIKLSRSRLLGRMDSNEGDEYEGN
ncbi:hypothetical protein CC1G_12894 [Coprinopsis cinerea okayama7|uniref:Uncharacterized protein n=1 Tax=Coprinopsis cinerea (strain Okayama-7 / 130 / ATCC MYA-4618 / FGSC 9003) TaxID=240176 RepID=A8PHW9_COPC7|nr:hypothetical protein CC1G_12894 [Coprinopsis cinerea okayama7\|eukprot:XP_001841479.1 hypothetical protein CC1G_12894 [Coprinopsis cinerea okayama7\